MITGKEELYFLLDAIDDARIFAPLKDLFINKKIEFSITLPEIKARLALFGFQD